MTAEGRRAMAERKVLELKEKLGGIGSEFDGWLADAGTGKPLRKHRTQITRLTGQLGAMADGIGGRIDEVSLDDDEVLAKCQQLQREMLEVHRLWDYFRSKFNLRYVSWFSSYLATADEFAWKCYEPAQDAARQEGAPALRGAPLVFLSGAFSPFTFARETPFAVGDEPDTTDSAQFQEFLAALPIPVVGVPWYQVAHLPDAVLIAHEVGHDVEKDFGLTAAIEVQAEAALGDLDPRDRFAWTSWVREVWADLYGVHAVGPAFVTAMIDMIVTDPAEIEADTRAPLLFGQYPPAWLRVRAMTYALEKTGFPEEAKRHWKAWDDAFEAGGADAIAAVAEGVVEALIAGSFSELGDQTLGAVLSFSMTQQQTAEEVQRAALANVVPSSSDIRCLVAGARLAFDADPELYGTDQRQPGSQNQILAKAVSAIGDQPRMRDAEQQVTEDEDRAAGEALFDRLVRGIDT